LQLRLGEFEETVLELRDQGRHAEAVENLGKMAALDPENPWPYELVVRIHSAPPRFDEAEQLMRSWGSQGPALAYGLAQIDFRGGRYESASATLEDALATYWANGHLAGQAFSHKAIGVCHLVERRLDQAEQALQESRRLFERLGDESWVANVLGFLAFVEQRRENDDAALQLLEEALEIQVRIEDLRGRGDTLQAKGSILKDAREYDLAIEALEQSVAIRRSLNDARNLYLSLDLLVRTYLASRQRERALVSILEAAELAKQMDYPERECSRRKHAGQILSDLGRHGEALEQLELARAAATETNETKWRASVDVEICAALNRAGRYVAAIELARDTVELAVQNDLSYYAALALTTQANSLRAVGRTRDALPVQQRALELFRTLDRTYDVLNALINLAAFHYYLGDSSSAKRLWEESLDLAQEQRGGKGDDRRIRGYEARARNGIGILLASQDRVAEARVQQLAALELWDSLRKTSSAAHARLSLAELERDEKRPERALKWVDEALLAFREVGNREGECFALNVRARALGDEGRHDEALAASTEALGLALEYGLRRAARISHGVRARVYEDAGQLNEAMSEYLATMGVMESQRVEIDEDELKIRFFTKTAEIYERAVDLQARIDRDEDPSAARAFRLAERARARGLLDLLAESAVSMRQSLPTELLKREQALADRLSAADVRRAKAAGPEDRARAEDEHIEAERELDRFKLELREKAPDYAQVVYPDPIDLGVLQRDVLRDGETLLRYFFGPDRAALWVVDRNQARYVELGDPTEIETLVDRFLARAAHAGAGLGARPEGEGLAAELAGKLLVEPIAPGRRLLVVSDGPLLRLPFEVLRRDDRYLVEDHEIAVVPSASVLGLLRAASGVHAAGGFLGLGEPLEPSGEASFPALPASAQALDRIAGLFPAQDRVMLRREACTKQALRQQPLGRFRFVHFATHGWLVSENPPRIGLRLSPAAEGGPASFLSMDDVFPLHLSAELVVLSGCQTGLGELLPGEGLVGLTRAFLYAGSRSVLVSLWNVSDRSTAEFMEVFYRALEGRTVPEALRQARLSFIRSERAAQRQFYRWAPFVLVGDPGTAAVQLNLERISSKKVPDGGS
jgi:tetratricopeptide (TPR) repeat protein